MFLMEFLLQKYSLLILIPKFIICNFFETFFVIRGMCLHLCILIYINIHWNIHLVNAKTRFQIYHAHINTYLMYLPSIWGHAHARHQDIDRLQVSRNYAVKLIFCRDPKTNTLTLYNELQVRELIKLDSLTFIFKIKNNLISTGPKLQLNCDIH